MKKLIRSVLLAFFAFVFLFSLWQLYGVYSRYKEGKDSYHSLQQYVSFAETQSSTAETVSPSTEPTTGDTADVEAPDVSAWPQIDFAQLSAINPDIVGWIYIEGTNINYPIVQGTDNDYYLNHLFDGTYNGAGCIFLDYRCASKFTSQHSILYGHHMKNKSMFYGLMNYKDQAFYNEHSVALLVTPDAYYKIRFFSGYVSDTSADAWKLTFTEEEYSNWLRDIQQRSCFATDYAPTVADKIITLSTCTYEFDDAKFVLHGYLAEMIEKKE